MLLNVKQKENFNYKLQSKVGIKYNKENILWTYIINRIWNFEIRCQNI